jgi:hypothetical protein
VILTAILTAAVSHGVSPPGTLFVFHLTLTAILNVCALFHVILTATLTAAAAVSHGVSPPGTLFVCHLTLTAILIAILIMTAVLVVVLEILILV